MKNEKEIIEEIKGLENLRRLSRTSTRERHDIKIVLHTLRWVLERRRRIPG